jgi:hypothetical protein
LLIAAHHYVGLEDRNKHLLAWKMEVLLTVFPIKLEPITFLEYYSYVVAVHSGVKSWTFCLI